MKPSQQCIDLIKSFEGLSLKAYRDPGSIDGRPITIGWGITNYLSAGVAKYGRSSVMLGDTLTAEEAEQELQANIARYAKFITGATNKLNQNQFDAAVSFVYNTGPNTRQITRLQSGAIADFRRTMPQYNKGGDGRVMPGLVRRRKAETDLWDGLTGEGKVGSDVATLKRTGKKRGNGLEILALEFGGELFECVSGQPYAQSFRKPNHPRSVPGCMEPIPFGDYRIGDIEWASGKDNYDASWGPGLGPVWIPLPANFVDDRSAFGIHLDSNASTSPGSAGCVVIPNVSELKRLVAALRKHDPKILKVAW